MSGAHGSSFARSRRACEHGWTIIELIVAMVLLAIALAVVSGVLVQGLSGGDAARGSASSFSAVQRASTAFGDDVSLTMTADRRDNLVRDPADLAAAVRKGEAVHSSDPSEPDRVVDVDDVVLATPSELRLQADVDPSPGTECVTWRATSGARLEIRRLVDRAGTCGTGNLDDDVMISSRAAAAAGIDTTPFSYRLVCSRALCTGSSAPAARPCAPWEVGSVPATQRRWVIGAGAAFGTVADSRDASLARDSAFMSIRSRETQSYREALGC